MSKIKKYKKFGKTILVGASSGLIVGMFLMGATTPAFAESSDFSDYSVPAYSQNTATTGMHMMHRWNSKSKINSLINSLGLDKNMVQAELNSGKSLKQILWENGVETEGLQKAFNGQERRNRKWNK